MSQCHSVTCDGGRRWRGERITDKCDSHCRPSDTVPALEIIIISTVVSLSLSPDWYRSWASPPWQPSPGETQWWRWEEDDWGGGRFPPPRPPSPHRLPGWRTRWPHRPPSAGSRPSSPSHSAIPESSIVVCKHSRNMRTENWDKYYRLQAVSRLKTVSAIWVSSSLTPGPRSKHFSQADHDQSQAGRNIIHQTSFIAMVILIQGNIQHPPRR